MINTDGWYDWAIRVPGPANKQYDQRNTMAGAALHSMEGYYAGSLAELNKAERQASWMASVKQDGTLVQHYPVFTSCWASGNSLANTTLVAFELEGVAGTPATEKQVATMLRALKELGTFAGFVPKRATPGRTLHEHREVWNWTTPNAGATSCPSDRYAPLYAALEGATAVAEEPVTRREFEDFLLAVFSGSEEIGDRATKLNNARYRVQQRVEMKTQSVAEKAEQKPTAVAPHRHNLSETGGVIQ